MGVLRAERVVKLTCGLGVLLLVTTQEKVCPWLEEVPRPVRPAGAEAEPGQPQGGSDSRDVPPPSLASTLPDVVAPRWPARALATPAPPLRGKFARSAVSKLSDGNVGSWDSSPAALLRVEPQLRPVVACCPADGGRPVLVRATAFLTCISPTGPPGA
jgi:hypothetical protein